MQRNSRRRGGGVGGGGGRNSLIELLPGVVVVVVENLTKLRGAHSQVRCACAGSSAGAQAAKELARQLPVIHHDVRACM